MSVPEKPYVRANESDFEVIPTGVPSKNMKTIKGYECQQWRVKNKSQKTEITFWVD